MGAFVWQVVEDRRCYGVVIYNFDGHSLDYCPSPITLYLGEPVIIKGECPNWYYVKKFESDEYGIIPKSYVRILEATVIRNGENEIVIPRTPTLAQEINSALREWHRISKKLFVSAEKFPKETGSTQEWSSSEPDSQTFTIMKQMILELHEFRKRVISSNLTVDLLKDLRKQVARIIDTGNNLLKLDMVVRDENGSALDPKTTSTMELFKQHQKSSHQLRKHGRGTNRRSRIFYHNSHSLLVTLEKISWRIVDECEVRFFLFDGEKEIPFTENVQCTFTAGVVPKLPVKILFTDLGKTVDFGRKKVFLVAYVVRIGGMEYKELEIKKDASIPYSSKGSIQVRRPYGVAAKDITYLFRENVTNANDNELQTVFYMPCVDDTMDATLLKLMQSKTSDPTCNAKDPRAVGLLVRFSMISGTAQQIHEEQPTIFKGHLITARKMGFPEVIYPNDVRNDLYINMTRGELLRCSPKSSDKNIEVTVSVHNEGGKVLPGMISGGNGSSRKDFYKSVVYYHEDKPKWNEYFKISLPMHIEEFSSAHIRFTFKHRSSTDSKDRSERPFALAYIRLKESDGTAIKDCTHDLIVYKVDPKQFKESEVQYLSMPYERTASWQGTSKQSCPPGFACVLKDSFFIRTTLCSTKFTQDAQLLELLQWVTKLKYIAESPHYHAEKDGQRQLIPSLLKDLKDILHKVQMVKGEEIVKFLTDVFDALFSILVDPVDSILTELRSGRASNILDAAELRRYEMGQTEIGTCDRPVFDCLIYIFGLILDHKYQNFQSVLTMYIEDGFFSTLAYKKLTKELERSISMPDQADKVLKIMKSIEFFFKFIIKSFQNHKRVLQMELGGAEDSDEFARVIEDFERLIDSLFIAMCRLLGRREAYSLDAYILAEGGCLKHIPAVITDLMQVYPESRLSQHLVEMVCRIPQGKLTKQKLQFITDIVHSDLFLDSECRLMLLPIITNNIQQHLPGSDEELRRKSVETQQVGSKNKLKQFFGTAEVLEPLSAHLQIPDPSNHLEETEKCVDLLGDVMDIFHKQHREEKKHHICYVMQILLRPIIISIGMIGDSDPLAGNMVAIFLSLLREMNSYDFEILTILINSFKAEIPLVNEGKPKQSLLKFLNDILVVLKNLFHKSYFPNDWSEMTLLQNSIVIGAFEHFAATVKNEFMDPFEEQPWNNFFQSAVSFLTQDSLQLEEFSQAKRSYITQNYGDMRKRAADLIRVMWFSLGESKRIRFVPTMVGTFLDMAFVPEPEIRETTIRIFFDMMHCEYDQDRPRKSFEQVEEELIRKIVEGFEGGKGDVEFRGIFFETMYDLCHNNTTGLKETGLVMVKTLTTLMELLLQYREVMLEEDSGNRMSCIVNLLDFSQEIDRKDLYLRYLYKLHDLHIQAGNFTEAAFTLKLHSRQLEWTDDEIPPTLRTGSNRHSSYVTQSELKEALYHEIIEYFSKGKMYECALEICDELRQQYAEEVYNYAQLSSLLQKMAVFYNNILREARFEPQYFRVAFYGKDFPTFLQEKVFVYRGGSYERLPDFEARMLERYPRAELLRTLEVPPGDIRNSSKQYLQICSVEPVMNPSKRISGMKYADENIRKYYKSNEVEMFTYSRPYRQEPRDPDNEFASLWLDRYDLWTTQTFPGTMSWFPVERQVQCKVAPILNAIETLKKTNEELRQMVLAHCLNPNENFNPLSMKLTGVLDAAVMGGVTNYEKAFLTPAYLEKNPNEVSFVEDLKRLIVSQVPIVGECLKIHERRCTSELKALHQNLEERYKKLLDHVEDFYGVHRGELHDSALHREMDRALKKQQAMRRLDLPTAAKETTVKLSDHHGTTRGSVTLGRSMTSFSSTISLYQNHPKYKSSQKSLGYFKRASQSSFSGSMDGDQMATPTPASATLPRNGPFFPSMKLAPVDSSNEGRSSQESLIPLTQTLVLQRPPRVNSEQRKSQSWTGSADNRSSVISMTSLDFPRPSNPYTSEPGSRTSFNSPGSPDSAVYAESSDDTAPPLPPKLRDKDKNVDNKPPTPPPKPPLKHFRDLTQT